MLNVDVKPCESVPFVKLEDVILDVVAVTAVLPAVPIASCVSVIRSGNAER